MVVRYEPAGDDPRPDCGHEGCRRHWTQTGSAHCVKVAPVFLGTAWAWVELHRDGKLIGRAHRPTESEGVSVMLRLLHDVCPASWQHSVTHEGYSIVAEDGRELVSKASQLWQERWLAEHPDCSGREFAEACQSAQAQGWPPDRYADSRRRWRQGGSILDAVALVALVAGVAVLACQLVERSEELRDRTSPAVEYREAPGLAPCDTINAGPCWQEARR